MAKLGISVPYPHVGDQLEQKEVVGDREDNKVDASLYIANPQPQGENLTEPQHSSNL